MVMVTSLCDMVKTVMDWLKDSDNVPNYQLISPIILMISAVSVCVCVCCVCVCGVSVCVVCLCVWCVCVCGVSVCVCLCLVSMYLSLRILSHRVGTNDSSDNK